MHTIMTRLKNKILGAFFALLFTACPFMLQAFPTTHYAANSKLSTGRWVRLVVWESGIYVLNQSDLASMGFSDISKVKVYGGGGAPLSESLTEDVYDDLPQVPVVRHQDRILFYAQGPDTWKNKPGFGFVQVLHPYSLEANYFITEEDGEEVTPQKASNEIVGAPVTTFTERLFHEEELVNPAESGRNMLGEDMVSNKTVSVKFSLPGLVDGSTVKVHTVYGVKLTQGKSRLSFTYNDNELPFSQSDECSIDTDDFYELVESTKTFSLEGTTELNYTITANHSGSVNFANLDYVTVNYVRQLELTGGVLQFAQNNKSGTDFYYVIGGGNDSTHVWDVTVPYAPIEMNTRFEDGKLIFSPLYEGYREYVAFNDNGSFTVPENEGTVSNQNLHGAPTPDMIIITNSVYTSAAERLAKFHETNDEMSVMVVSQRQVFNEFSSGVPDAMAFRRLCKMMWDRGVDTAGHHLQYLLLMGDGTYDNKSLTREVKSLHKHTVLTWQSEDSNTDDTYTTDDCFGILADNSKSKYNEETLNIAVGRYPVSEASEAVSVVNKLIKYMGTPDFGLWKNNSLNVADDQDDGTHMSQAEDVITTARENGGEDIIFTHVFIDAFPVTSVGASRTFPEAKTLMMKKLQEGVLWWNYTGHASANNWGSEGMLRRTDITDNLYYDHLPVLYGATCSFAKFDGLQESGAENMVLNPRGGAIAVISAARAVAMFRNGPLNKAVAKYIFAKDEHGRNYRLGDILRMAKNDVKTEFNKLNYFLLGDPALRMSIPENRVVITTINDQPVNSENRPVFQGRQTITLTGVIQDREGQKCNEFNGLVHSTLFDSEQSVTTNGYEGSEPFTYLERPNKLAITVDTVVAGSFQIKITIPSELIATYENFSPSLLNLYAYDESSNQEASGSCSDFYIYGYDDTASADTEGPDISFFGLNSSDFADGDAVNESPLVLATISDESGVNFSTAGVGHNITLVLDGIKTYSDLSNYYTPQTCYEGTLGSFSFPLSDLENGEHTLRLRVWDVHNNMSEKTIRFVVSRSLKPEVVEVYATNNPAKTSTTFYVKHNRPNAQMIVGIEVFNLMGHLVWSTKASGKSNQFMTFPVTWDLNSSNGGRVQRGIYIYRATISTDGEHEASKAKKLAITAQ